MTHDGQLQKSHSYDVNTLDNSFAKLKYNVIVRVASGRWTTDGIAKYLKLADLVEVQKPFGNAKFD